MIYFDHNATTPVDAQVLEKMQPFFSEAIGNPSSVHAAGRRARLAIDNARDNVAGLLGADPSEIIFTSGATEANNLAIKGAAWWARSQKKDGGQNALHLVTTAVEHPSVLGPIRRLAQEGFSLTVVGVDRQGHARPEALRQALEIPGTILLSLQYANNETGTIQNIESLCCMAKERGVLVHVDAAQAVGKIPVLLQQLPVDLLTFSAHKFYGPKGVGGLFIRRGVRIASLNDGGVHEKKLRPGTENVAGIVGLAEALAIACEDMANETAQLRTMKDQLAREIKNRIADVEFNGDMSPEGSLANTLNVCFHGADAQGILMNLDLEDICVSTGAACSSGAVEPSPVLKAMTGDAAVAKSSIRISTGRSNTPEQVAMLVEALERAVKKVRGATPSPWPSPLKRGEGVGEGVRTVQP